MIPKYCHVIISAFNAKRYIGECLESVRRQRRPLGWDIKVMVGVDGCEETSEHLSKMGYRHYFSPVNVGPYVIRNSLMMLKRADAYAIFDADDVMTDSYLTVSIERLGKGIVGCARHIMDADGRKRSGRNKYRCGICTISQSALDKLGGYLGHRVAADHDLIERAKLLNIPVIKVSSPMYYRRIHSTSLTQAYDTGMKSSARHDCVVAAKALRLQGQLQVVPETTKLEIREGWIK